MSDLYKHPEEYDREHLEVVGDEPLDLEKLTTRREPIGAYQRHARLMLDLLELAAAVRQRRKPNSTILLVPGWADASARFTPNEIPPALRLALGLDWFLWAAGVRPWAWPSPPSAHTTVQVEFVCEQRSPLFAYLSLQLAAAVNGSRVAVCAECGLPFPRGVDPVVANQRTARSVGSARLGAGRRKGTTRKSNASAERHSREGL